MHYLTHCKTLSTSSEDIQLQARKMMEALSNKDSWSSILRQCRWLIFFNKKCRMPLISLDCLQICHSLHQHWPQGRPWLSTTSILCFLVGLMFLSISRPISNCLWWISKPRQAKRHPCIFLIPKASAGTMFSQQTCLCLIGQQTLIIVFSWMLWRSKIVDWWYSLEDKK